VNGVNEWIAFGQLDPSPEIHIDLVGSDNQAIYDVNRFFNDGSGNLIPQYPPFLPSTDSDQLELADLDDYQLGTLPELIVATGYQIKIYNNNGAGSFNPTPRQVLNVDYPDTPVMDFVVGDINNDDFPDIVACTIYTIKTFINWGDGMLYNANQPLLQQDYWELVALTNWDDDAYPDLALSYGQTLRIYPDTNSGYFATAPVWQGWMESYPSYVAGKELIVADLTGTGTHSLICTGLQAYSGPGLWVFKDHGDPRICPVKNFNVMDGEGHHPELHWQASPADDAWKYRIFRALTETDDPPPLDAFVLIDSVDHPNDSYTDYDVYIVQQHPNCKIWYFVKAVDLADQESVPSNVVRFWGIYHPESNQPAKELVAVASPTALQLHAVPNPFNPTTTIGFSLSEASHVTLSVYDLQGRQMATLINGWREAGNHEVTFQAGDLPSGIYIYRVTAGKFNSSGKMVLMK